MKKEIIFFDDNMPISIDVVKLDNSYSMWNEDLKIIYILKGDVFLSLIDKQYELDSDSIFIINSYTNFNLYNRSESASIIFELTIKLEQINKIYPEFSNTHFFCYSNSENEDVKYNEVKKFLAQIADIIINEKSNKKKLLIFKKNLDLCYWLVENFKISLENNPKSIKKNYIMKIVEYLHEHYADENLSIYEISDHVSLTPQYTLKLFKQNFNVGLMDYLNNIRISKSLNSLLYSNKSIIEIAMENGFSNSKTYHRVFKNIYNRTPGDYKKSGLTRNNHDKFIESSDKSILLSIVEKYKPLKIESSLDDKKEISLIELDLLKINRKSIKPYWNKILSLGKAFEGLKGEVQYQIKEIISEINFEFIKINNIFSDELFIYNEDEEENACYNFAYIDKLIDFFIELKLKPYINIGFTPKKLKSAEQYVLSTNVSYPKSILKWNDLIKTLFTHFKEKYGSQVFQWKFEIWNNSDAYKTFWYESDEKFFEFFKDTYNSIKAVSSDYKIGGPSVIIYEDTRYIEKFFKYIEENQIDLSFMSFHFYNIKRNSGISINKSKWNFEFYEYDISRNMIKDYVAKVKGIVNKKMEIIISEWNSSPYYLDLTHDTCYMNTFIADTVIHNINQVEALSYWTLIESRLGSGLFHGGFGLFTINNLKKSSYNTFLLLNKLGNKMISKGDNHIITSSEKGYQILLYNHSYYNEEYRKGNFDIINLKERYNAFEDKSKQEIIIDLKNIESGDYITKKYYLNKQDGSIFDSWIQMGAPNNITEEIFNYLKSKEKMRLEILDTKVHEKLFIKETLGVHEIVFLEFIKN